MPKNHFSAKGIKQPRISDVADVIRAGGKEVQLCGMRERGWGVCLRSPIIRSQVNSRNSCRRRRHRCRRRCRRLCTATLVKATKAACGRAARFIYAHARLACKSSIRRNIDRQRDHTFSPRFVVARTIHVDIVILLLWENAASSLLKRENLLSSYGDVYVHLVNAVLITSRWAARI